MKLGLVRWFVAASCLLLLTVGASADIIGVEFRRTQEGTGNRSWGQDNFGCAECPQGGSTCLVVVISHECGGICEDVMPPGILVHAPIPGLTATNTTTNQTATISTANFHFLPNEFDLVIKDYPSRPWYNGVGVHLDGLTADAQGVVHVLFPWITQ